jgi:predicted protein tyrosine phosphatase
MPKIINISYMEAKTGQYQHPGKSVLIQITDPDVPAPSPSYRYEAAHHFQFHDTEDNESAGEFPYVPKVLFKDYQAKEIVEILQNAIDNDTNVVVHCHAGLCRSGAVCEVGVMMGFDDPKRVRMPNRLVKYKLMRELGWTYE